MFGQHIQNIASFFGTFDVSLPFARPLSDKLVRRISVLIGAASYVIFFIGIAFSPNIQVAYVAAVLGGIAIGILGVLAIFAPMPAGNAAAKSESFISSLKNANFSVESIALILIASSLCNYTILKCGSENVIHAGDHAEHCYYRYRRAAGSFCQCEIRKSFSEDRTIKKRSLRV